MFRRVGTTCPPNPGDASSDHHPAGCHPRRPLLRAACVAAHLNLTATLSVEGGLVTQLESEK